MPNGIDPSLEQFLKEVWAQRTNIKSKSDVYRIYNRCPNPSPLADQSWERFWKTTERMIDLWHTHQLSVSVQSFWKASGAYNGYREYFNLCAVAMQCMNMKRAAPAGTEEALKEIGRWSAKFEPNVRFLQVFHSTFFHFSNRDRTANTAEHRVYISALADHAMDVMEFVVPTFVVAMPDKIHSAKIGGPITYGKRRDTIVIYCLNTAAAQSVLESLKTFHGEHSDYFADQVPPMLKKVEDMKGVATAAEPLNLENLDAQDREDLEQILGKDTDMVVGSHSFGSRRSAFIYIAPAQRHRTRRQRNCFHRAGQNRVRGQRSQSGAAPSAGSLPAARQLTALTESSLLLPA